MRTVLDWWRRQHGPEFEMLGGKQVDDLPSSADYSVKGFMFSACDQYGFVRQPDKLGYRTITVKRSGFVVS